MIIPGLVSITFRRLPPREIVRLVSEAGLACIEWGGDIHVPHGNLNAANEVRGMSEDSGIAVASYGSYYRAGLSEDAGLPFSSVLETALALNAPGIRVWAGNKNWEDADSSFKKNVIDDLLRIGCMASSSKISISLEYHGATLTSSNESALSLAKELAGSNVFFYWQPPVGKDFAYCADGLVKLLDLVSHVHVFHWAAEGGGIARMPLAKGGREWSKYFEILSSSGGNHSAMLEHVRDDSPEQFLEDAAILKKMTRI